MLEIGDRVKRGKDWRYGGQGSGTFGTVTSYDSHDDGFVKWDNGYENIYPNNETGVVKLTHEDYKEGDLVVVTEFKGEKEWSGHWFIPGEVLKLGGEYWEDSLEDIFIARSTTEVEGAAMWHLFEKGYKLRHATAEEIANSIWADEEENCGLKAT